MITTILTFLFLVNGYKSYLITILILNMIKLVNLFRRLENFLSYDIILDICPIFIDLIFCMDPKLEDRTLFFTSNVLIFIFMEISSMREYVYRDDNIKVEYVLLFLIFTIRDTTPEQFYYLSHINVIQYYVFLMKNQENTVNYQLLIFFYFLFSVMSYKFFKNFVEK